VSRIIVDLETGAAMLLHDIPESVVDGDTLPDDAVKAVKSLAGVLGVLETDLTGAAKGWLFELIEHLSEAAGAAFSGHASAVTAPESAETPPAASETPSEAAPPPTEGTPSLGAGPTPTTHSPAGPNAPTASGAKLEDLPPVTVETVSPGNQLCPTCQGLRTQFIEGGLRPCPKCLGAGEVAPPEGTTPGPAPAA
jgi:hypothetical protein